jgi:hypothetical protein
LSFVSFISSSSCNWNASATVLVAATKGVQDRASQNAKWSRMGPELSSIAVQHPITSQVLGFGSIAALPEEIFFTRSQGRGKQSRDRTRRRPGDSPTRSGCRALAYGGVRDGGFARNWATA